MNILDEFDQQNGGEVGKRIYQLAAELYPICRSITGDGIRQTLSQIQEHIPLTLTEVPSGVQVLDWMTPKEWNIRDAYIKAPDGKRIADFRNSNLHVLNYSVPVHRTMSLAELRPHLFSIPEHPDWIPYRTSYYEENWGFCIRHSELLRLQDGPYEVLIDSSLEPGRLAYGECYLPGERPDEVLVSCHCCHPSLANDNLSGLAVACFLAKALSIRSRRYSYRFLFLPGTIGAIAWLAKNPNTISRIANGLVLTCIGDSGGFHYKKSRRGNAHIDRIAAHVLRHCGEPSEIMEFSPVGYDERQYCSPGFNLPVGCLMRSVWGTFPEYHTSADNLDFIRPDRLQLSLRLCTAMVDVLENDQRYRSLVPYGEPQLGRRGLLSGIGGELPSQERLSRLWVLNLSDGDQSLLDIAERSGIPFAAIRRAANVLCEKGLLEPCRAKDTD